MPDQEPVLPGEPAAASDAAKLAKARGRQQRDGDNDIRFYVTLDDKRYLVSLRALRSADARAFEKLEGLKLAKAAMDWDPTYGATMAYLTIRKQRPDVTWEYVDERVDLGDLLTSAEEADADEEEGDGRAPEA